MKMPKLKTKNIIRFSGILLLVVIGLMINHFVANTPSKKTYDGYIVWGRSVVFYVDDFELLEDSKFTYDGEPIWIENGLTDEIYKNAYIIDEEFDTRVTKASFIGYQYDNIKYNYPINSIEFNSKVKVKEIFDYSIDGIN